jgi:hypothetical protein
LEAREEKIMKKEQELSQRTKEWEKGCSELKDIQNSSRRRRDILQSGPLSSPVSIRPLRPPARLPGDH